MSLFGILLWHFCSRILWDETTKLSCLCRLIKLDFAPIEPHNAKPYSNDMLHWTHNRWVLVLKMCKRPFVHWGLQRVSKQLNLAKSWRKSIVQQVYAKLVNWRCAKLDHFLTVWYFSSKKPIPWQTSNYSPSRPILQLRKKKFISSSASIALQRTKLHYLIRSWRPHLISYSV